MSFQLGLERLVSREAPWSAILSGTAGAKIRSLHTFLEILSGNGPEYDSDDIDCYAPSHMCYYIDSEVPADEAPELTPPDLSPRSRANYIQETVDRLRAQQVDLEAAEAELSAKGRTLHSSKPHNLPSTTTTPARGHPAPCASPGRPTTWWSSPVPAGGHL
jgi:hypothetical protein